MLQYQPWLTALIVGLGNCGFWVFWFNRINAIGLPRRTTKRIEKGIVAICFAIPILIGIIEWKPLQHWLWTSHWWPTAAPLSQVWGAWCFASALIMGTMWLESRRWLWPPRHLLREQAKRLNLSKELGRCTAVDPLTARLAKIPGNQICHLEVTRKEIQLPRSIPAADGLRIGHISDLHFTGKYSQDHYALALREFMALGPDLIVITGDIIDYPEYLEWIEPLLGTLRAPGGIYFVLGNHDLRLPSIKPLLDRLAAIGHIDVGTSDHHVQLPSGLVVNLSGNERPWFERHLETSHHGSRQRKTANDRSLTPLVPTNNALHVGLSHTPDQIRWARSKRLDLLFAGHTHGGQFRPPGIGPILSPSLYGSKFASGLFYLHPTLMHVSRGVSGTHPLRWWCPPEVTLLTLRSA